MKYAKPEVVVVASAVEAIQTHTSKDSLINVELDSRPTKPAAYEADE